MRPRNVSLKNESLQLFPPHSHHPSNQTVVVAETAVDSLVCLTGLTIAEWNNLKYIHKKINDMISARVHNNP